MMKIKCLINIELKAQFVFDPGTKKQILPLRQFFISASEFA